MFRLDSDRFKNLSDTERSTFNSGAERSSTVPEQNVVSLAVHLHDVLTRASDVWIGIAVFLIDLKGLCRGQMYCGNKLLYTLAFLSLED